MKCEFCVFLLRATSEILGAVVERINRMSAEEIIKINFLFL